MKIQSAASFPLFSALVLVSCGAQPQPGARSPAASATSANLITAEDTPAGHKQVIDALQTGGHQCDESAEAIGCDAKKEHAFTFGVAFADGPRRLVIVVPSVMKVPCEDATARFNALNHQFETVTLTCDKTQFTAAGVIYIPSGGLSAADLNSFVSPWLQQLATIIVANKLDEIVK